MPREVEEKTPREVEEKTPAETTGTQQVSRKINPELRPKMRRMMPRMRRMMPRM